MRVHNATTFIAGMVLMLAATLAHGQSYSVVGGSLLVPIPGDDILNPGPIPVLPGAGAGVGVGLEVDAFSYGHRTDFQITDFQFSIDPFSSGVPGTAAFAEAGPGDQPADIYNSTGGGFNTLLWDGDGIAAPGLAPGLGLIEGPPVPLGHDVDGWDNRLSSAADIYFSMDPATAGLVGPFFAADVLIAPAVPGYDTIAAPYAPSFALGLDGFGLGTDDIDALVVFDISGSPGVFDPGDYILFSLAPGSPSLFLPSPYTGGAEDVFIAFGGGGGGLFAPGAALGLAPGDNLDALDVIPEPSVVLMMLSGGAGLYIKKRFFSV